MNDKNTIERTRYVDQIIASLWSPIIKVITGMRRVGKSSILESILARLKREDVMREDQIFHMNKELPEFFHIRMGEDLWLVLEPFLVKQTDRCIIAIDEIQEITWWEKVIAGIQAQYGSQADIIITGSNSHLLGGELATLIAGRYITFQIFPLTWNEYRQFSKGDPTRDHFLEYMEFGGLPGIHMFRGQYTLILSYLRSVYESIVLRDIVERFQIRNLDFLRNLYYYTGGNIWHIVSAQSIARYLRNQKITISVDSIIQYLSYGIHTYIFDKVHSIDSNSKKIFEIYNKYYFWDIWLRNSVVGYALSRDISGILENIVYLHLRTYGYSVVIGRAWGDLEVDFIASRWWEKYYFQVTTTLMDTNTRQREYESLECIDDHYPKYVIHFDDIDWWVTQSGINHISLLDFEDRLIRGDL